MFTGTVTQAFAGVRHDVGATGPTELVPMAKSASLASLALLQLTS
jgi:hypothetical protein